MFVDLTPEQHALRLKVRDYFSTLLTPEQRVALRGAESGELFRRTVRKMGADGWLAVGWPKEYGGQGYSGTEQLIFFEEANIAGAPLPFVTISTVGPALMAHGSAYQKERFLPGIAAGEINFAIGYSEPDAGSDLATLKTAARVEGDGFVVNGNKLWTSGAEAADWIWLAARTDPERPRHTGISVLIVDAKSPGFSHTVITTVGNATAATFYDDVRVPREMLVGELHGGWKLITSQLNHERLGLGSWSDKVFGPFRRVYLWAKATDEQGRRAVDQPWVRRALADCYTRLEAQRTLNFRIAADVEAGNMDVALASTAKVYSSETVIEVLRRLIEIVGASALVRAGSAAALLMGELEYEVRAANINTFGGGTNELQRELIAQFGLGLPRTGASVTPTRSTSGARPAQSHSERPAKAASAATTDLPLNPPENASWQPVAREVTQALLDRRAVIAARFLASDKNTLAEKLESASNAHADRPLLRYGQECWSYADVNRRANQVAHAARGLGVKRGDVVALAMENRPAFFAAWFGLAKLGATVAFLNTNIGGRALAHEFSATGASAAVVGEECLAAFDVPEVRGRVPLWRWPDAERPADAALRALAPVDFEALALAAPDSNPDAAWRAGLTAGDPCVYIFTSGTTGLPKAAVISHARWLLTGAVMRESMAVGPDDCFYTFLPLYHGAASLSAGSTAIEAGASLALRRKFSRREFWSDVRRHGVTGCQYIGEICRYLLSEPPRADDREHPLRFLVGAGLTSEVWTRFVDRFGPMRIYEGWGATEANANTLNLDNRVGSCGRVPFWEKTNLRLVRYDVETDTHPRDADGFLIPCQPGEVGEAIGLLHNYPDVVAGRFEGYTAAAETEKKIIRNVFRAGDAAWASGDLLRCDDDGYCWFVDRIGDTFRWKSENVSTMEVADCLAEVSGIEAVTVYGVQVPGAEGRAGMAAIVMQEGRAFDPQALFDFANARLPRYAAPLFVRVSVMADMTSTFKLRKVDLQRAGFDPAQVSDPLYVRDDRQRCYVPLTPEGVERALAV